MLKSSSAIAATLLTLGSLPASQSSHMRSGSGLSHKDLNAWGTKHFPQYVKMLTGTTNVEPWDHVPRCGGVELEQGNDGSPDAGAPGMIFGEDGSVTYGVSVNPKFVSELPEICQLFGIGHEWGHLMHEELVASIEELTGPALTPGKDEILADILATRTLHKFGGFSFDAIGAAIQNCDIFGTIWDSHGHPPGAQRRANVQSYCKKREAESKREGASAETWKATLVQIVAEASHVFTQADLEAVLLATKGEGKGEAAKSFVNIKCTGPKGCEKHQTDEACSEHKTLGGKLCSWMTVCNNNPGFCSDAASNVHLMPNPLVSGSVGGEAVE